MNDDADTWNEWTDWLFSLPAGDWTDPDLTWSDQPAVAWEAPE